MRRHYPRFSPGNFEKNIKLVHELEAIAKRKGCTTGQIGLAWVRSQSGRDGLPTIIPIPGATTADRVRENTVEVELSENDLKEIDSLLAGFEVIGGRYPEHAAALSFGNSPELKE